MHRAHFIAVVYSRLALKQSGANSQAPFRLNSSVKNSWQYLFTKQTNKQRSVNFRHHTSVDLTKFPKNTSIHLQRTRLVCTSSLCDCCVASVEYGFFMLAHDSRFASARIKLIGSLSKSDCELSGRCSRNALTGSFTAVN